MPRMTKGRTKKINMVLAVEDEMLERIDEVAKRWFPTRSKFRRGVTLRTMLAMALHAINEMDSELEIEMFHKFRQLDPRSLEQQHDIWSKDDVYTE